MFKSLVREIMISYGMIKCNKCDNTKPNNEFYLRKAPSTYRKECKMCSKKAKAIRERKPGVKQQRAEKEKLRRLLNKDRINATLKEQRRGTEEKRIANNKATADWRKTPSGIISTKKTSLKKRAKYTWSAENRSLKHQTSLLYVRRARYIKSSPNVPVSTKEEYSNEFLPTTKFCRYCGRDCGKNWTLDHIVPTVKGGDNTTDNLVVSCKSCNSSKNSTSLIVWLATVQNLKHSKLLGNNNL